jgi:hypothetical protein
MLPGLVRQILGKDLAVCRDRALATPWLTKTDYAFVEVRSGGILYELTAYLRHSQLPAWWPKGSTGCDGELGLIPSDFFNRR